MAHIFDLAPAVRGHPKNYTNGKITAPGAATTFPATPVFAGMNKPSRFEGDIFDLEVTGKIPEDINGTFYRIQAGLSFVLSYPHTKQQPLTIFPA